ncbi:retrovirus-related pol polyprotein from transposon TNT 1-94 [Tanacetum coccineum]
MEEQDAWLIHTTWMREAALEIRCDHTKFKGKSQKGLKCEGMMVKGYMYAGKTDRRDNTSVQGWKVKESKSRGGRLKCYIFQSEDHLKRNCPKNNPKKSTVDDGDRVAQGLGLLDLRSWHSGCWLTTRECKIKVSAQVRIQLKTVKFVYTTVREGYTVKLQSGKVKVINGSRVILSGIRRDNCVYSLDDHAIAGLQVLEKQGLFGKKSLGKLDFYENCVMGKSHQVSFGVGRHTTQGVIDYVHSDLWGPSQVESFEGKRYFLSIVDDYSRRVWVYFLRFKHEAFGKFKEWKQLVENQTRRTVKKLRTDNGLEFCNREFEKLCIESGIARHLTVVGMPQQNGVAKRMNRTLMDKARYLLIQSGLLKTFWVEATCMAAYLINRSPSRAIEKKTPMEMWPGHPSDYGMLRIFSCVAYLHDKQGKLEPRAVKYVLLGYPEGVKGYKLYRLDDESSKIVTSRNFVFNESVMYKDTLKDSGAGDKSVEELQVEVELQRVNNHTPKEDQTNQEDGVDEDAGDQETNQPPDLTDYQLVRDREPRTRTKPLRILKVVQKPRYKASLEARGFTQRAGIDYNEVFSLELNVLDGVHEARHSVHAVSVVRRIWKIGVKNHWEAMKWILKYLRGTANVGLVYGTDRGNHVDVTGFVDSDYAKDPDKGRSITGYAFLVQGCVVSWKATLQHVVALSTTEAEYMALTEAVKEAIWLKGLLEELGVELNTVAVNCDNQGAIHLSRNHVFHERTKHINVRYHFIREVLEAKTVKVLKVGTEHNVADALTKVVPGRKLQHCLELLKGRRFLQRVNAVMAMKVEKRSSKFVKPFVQTSSTCGSYRIGFTDELAPLAYFSVVLFFSPNSNFSSKLVAQLEKSLEKTLTRLYPLAGRYVDEMQTVECNDKGAEFIHAEVNIKLQNFLGLEMNVELVDEFIPFKSSKVPLVYNDPLLAIQVTMFECGYVAVGVSVVHKIANKSTLCTFLNEWACMNQEENDIEFTGPGFNSSTLFPSRGIRPIPLAKIDAMSSTVGVGDHMEGSHWCFGWGKAYLGAPRTRTLKKQDFDGRCFYSVVQGNGVEAYIYLEVKDVPYFKEAIDVNIFSA